VTIIGSGGTTYTDFSIVIEGGALVTLDAVNINNSVWSSGTSPVISGNSNTGNTLYFEGINTLTAPDFQAGISVCGSNALVIDKALGTSDVSSILNVYGGGVGGNGGIVTINGGTVKASGNSGGAGIGGGVGGNGGTVTINGGTVKASGNSGGAGIGGGYSGNGGTTDIYGGTVKANGTSGGAGIGAGDTAAGGTNVFVGGSINASSVSSTPTLVDSTPLYETEITLSGVSLVTPTSCTINSSTFSASTDASGILYLWLPTTVQTITITDTDTGKYYHHRYKHYKRYFNNSTNFFD
jgi:hypothetical protein